MVQKYINFLVNLYIVEFAPLILPMQFGPLFLSYLIVEKKGMGEGGIQTSFLVKVFRIK